MAIKAGPKAALTGALPECADGVEFSELTQGPLYRWQAPIVRDLTGETRPRVAFVQVARKNGKSRTGASVAIDEMCRWGGQVFLISDSKDNLKSALYFELCNLIRNSPTLSNAVHIYKDHLECPSTGGMVSLRPNNLSAAQSINPTVVVFDEVHMQRTDEIWNGMILACDAAERGLVLGITTPGYDVTCMAHGLYQAVKAGADPTLYGRIYEPTDLNVEFGDIDQPMTPALRQAVLEANPVLLDRPEMFDRFDLQRTKISETDYRRFRLGMWTTGARGWFPYGTWDGRKVARELQPGETIWVGFDGSYSGDSTALVACTADGFVKVLGCWENPGRKGWRVPRQQVEDTIESVMALYDVRELLCDPPYWASEISAWDKRWPGRVIEFPTYVRARMAPACTTFHSAVMDGRLTHDGDPRLARHVANAVVMSSLQGDYITKADKDSPAKIDLAVAAVIAASRALLTAPPRRAPVFVV